jgi:ABC-type uncharacterized transport system ATPase component
MTVVLVTHESDIAAWARRKIVFRDGHILEDVLQDSKQSGSQNNRGQIPIPRRNWKLTPIPWN